MTTKYRVDYQIQTVHDLTLLQCGECGIEFAVPERFYAELRECRQTWFCPNGHDRVFREREVDGLKRELEYKNSRIDTLTDETYRLERQRRAEKAAKTRLKRRIANGVCPCCKRHFANVQKHMKSQHPDFMEDE